MTARTHRRNLFAGVLVGAALLASALPAAAADPAASFNATQLTPVTRIDGFKSVNAGIVKSDAALLKRTDSARVHVVVKLDYDGLSSYAGGIDGLAATSPRVTGHKLTGRTAAEVAYNAYAKGLETSFVSSMKKLVPSAKVGTTLRLVYGGVAASLPAKDAKTLLKIDGVVAVQADSLRQPLTDASSDFIDATAVQQALGGRPDAGKGVIFGSLDSGIWPEHPSFADTGNLGAPPPKTDGTPRACDFGDNPLTSAVDPFACNHKVIGGKAFLATYLSNPTDAANEPFHTSRDSNGHGSHTASTSAGDVVASAKIFGVERGPINGAGARRLGLGLQGLRHQGLLRLRLCRRGRPGDQGWRRTSSTSRSRAAPIPAPTRSSWPSSTPTPPAYSCRPRPATTARARARPTTSAHG